MAKTVFISSTYRDLIPHRDVIWKVLQNFDVKITGMEAFGARRSNPLDTCFDEVKSSDIYIGIISMCYGSIDDLTGKSYTQLEYEKAKELGLEILIYLIDESQGVIKTGNIDFGDKSLRLNSFKNILKKNHTVDFFNNETDLGSKINNRLEKLLPTPGQLLTRPKSIEAKVNRIKLDNESWIIFIGYYNGRPFEVWSGMADDMDGILLPKSVDKGLLTQRDYNGVTDYDFTFQNQRGYKTTIEGISHMFDFQINTYDKVVSNLLRSDVHLSVITSTIQNLTIENKKHRSWNEKLIEILEK
ncbi:DUF4062 domain-containing protein [Carboxylicivirga sp. M1479]|uniref:DUF4062 domain-containing protein n=1 Tax=Carboxylicivirga sp. M1479 TaxID=2594476 RepID=UPI00117811C9|nr:DUF4062 domain-containing protein [Carboxylicivirga sp. M1479]TRX72578.1 DUF4062 domain-containing protein [Carboxylicivirga sp. M1479]